MCRRFFKDLTTDVVNSTLILPTALRIEVLVKISSEINSFHAPSPPLPAAVISNVTAFVDDLRRSFDPQVEIAGASAVIPLD